MSKKDNKAKLPSIFKMAANFAKDLTKYVKEGAPNVTHKQYLARLEACKKCPHLIEPTMRCGKCGCLLEHKAKWRTTTCPDEPQRWEPLYLSPEDLVKIETAKELVEADKKEEEYQQKLIASKEYKDKIRSWNKKIKKEIKDGRLKLEARDDAKFAIYEEDLPREGYPFSSITGEEAKSTREQFLRKTKDSKDNKGDKKKI
tara:strand:+ start:1367 stop:1969 length:603 start_codon:yes stop_codon:yes gene_type:complete